MFTGNIRKTSKSLTSKIAIECLAVLFVVVLAPGLFGIASQASAAGACTDTARAAFVACEAEADDDYYIALGNCFNISDDGDRAECIEEAEADLAEAEELCPEQRAARIDICDTLGEDPYDPATDPDNFVNPLKIGKRIRPNPYLPLVPGTVRKYIVKDRGGKVIEKIKVEVLKETKEIRGVTCIVVHDRVWEIDDGEKSLIEDTFDWLAQDKDGNVWYFGEISKEFEDGELIGIEGSWKAGRDFAKQGILMKADPLVGDLLYRQEFALGDAEDMGEVIGLVRSVEVRGKKYRKVLQTQDFTPIEPDGYEFKYYAPGVGVILEEGFDGDGPTGERVELVQMKFTGGDDDDDDDGDDDDDDDDDDRRRRH